MNPVIRLAMEADVASIAMLECTIQIVHHAIKPALFKVAEPTKAVEWWRARLASPDARVWIAEAEGAAIGFVSVALREHPETPLSFAARSFEIEYLAVRPDVQRQGVARALVRHVVAEARAAGIPEVTLTAWAENPAAQMALLRLGFRPELVGFRMSC